MTVLWISNMQFLLKYNIPYIKNYELHKNISVSDSIRLNIFYEIERINTIGVNSERYMTSLCPSVSVSS